MNKIGYIQFQPVLGDIDANIKKIESLFPLGEKADLIVLPELASSGYNFATRDEAFKSAEELTKSKFVEFIIANAKKQNQYIVAGINEKVTAKFRRQKT